MTSSGGLSGAKWWSHKCGRQALQSGGLAVERLDVGYNEIGDVGLAALATACCSGGVTEFGFGSNCSGDKGGAAVANCLEAAPKCKLMVNCVSFTVCPHSLTLSHTHCHLYLL